MGIQNWGAAPGVLHIASVILWLFLVDFQAVFVVSTIQLSKKYVQ